MTHRAAIHPPLQPRLLRAYTGFVMDIFRLNGDQIALGNAISAHIGLTSALWQVLGALFLSHEPIPVAHIARNMGLTRQAVQRSVNELLASGHVRLVHNPHHRRAMLIALTEKGEAAHQVLSDRHARWVESAMAELAADRVEAASELLREVQRRILSSGALEKEAFRIMESRDA